MTQDKARKAATRQRMAETGEPYSVARHAVETEAADQSAPEPAPAASSCTACLATLYGSPVSAIRWRVAVFRALSCVMIISSRRVGPRLPAMGEWHDC